MLTYLFDSLYPRIFKEEKRYANPYMTDAEFEVAFHNEFIVWFSHYVRDDKFMLNIHLLTLKLASKLK